MEAWLENLYYQEIAVRGITKDDYQKGCVQSRKKIRIRKVTLDNLAFSYNFSLY